MKVCHVITKLELGGAQQNTLYTIRHLDRRRFAPMLIAGPGGLLDEQAAALEDVPFETCPHLDRALHPARDLTALVDLTRRLRAWRPQVVHTHSSKAGILGRLAAWLAGVPVIIHTVHGWGFHPGQGAVRRRAFVIAERVASLMTTQLVCVSRANAETGAALRIAPLEAFEVIHSGVELGRFRQASGSGALRRRLGLDGRVPLVGMVACFKPQKAPLDFVAVAARVAAARPDAQFVLAGDGELRPDVERAIAEAGLRGRCHLLGWCREPEKVIGDLDVMVLTSLHEGLPRVIPEAMAAGKPVVATAVDGSPEAVLDGQSGFLHQPGDTASMARDVLRLLADAELAHRMVEAGREQARGWDIDEMVRHQERLYERLLADRGGLRRGSLRVDTHRGEDSSSSLDTP
ncbi:MAG: glycosyltransferase family 4 protein [Acidobacteriota bacterium]|nr:MAG: glycosyltransferase family 4 protein [Acidobacteriota bacterium]